MALRRKAADQVDSVPGPAAKRRRNRGKFLCALGFVLAILALSTHWLARAYLVFDFFNNLTLQYAIAAAAFAIGYLMPRARVMTALVLILAGLLAVSVWPHYVSDQPVQVAELRAGERAVKLMTFNTWSLNRDWQAIVAEIERHDPDIVTMVEFGEEKRKAFYALKARYPYSEHCMDKRYCHLAMMSKLPLYDVKARSPWQGPPYIRARLGPEYGRTHVFGVHSTRPPHVRSQIQQINTLARFLKKFAGPKIVMGDFNSTPYATLLTRFTANSGLTRLTSLPTFPARFGPFPQIAIDHVFLSRELRQLSRARIGQNAGSDHYPVIVDIAVPAD